MDSNTLKPKTVDEYLALLPADQRKALQAVRRAIAAAAPDATEVIRYGIPGFKNLLSFAAFKNHLTLFAGRAVNQKFASQLRAFERTKGGIRFTPQKPIPPALIKRIVHARLADNAARARTKAR